MRQFFALLAPLWSFSSYLVADERHPAVVRPGEADDGRVAVVDELDGPAALVLEPQLRSIRLFESLVTYKIDLIDLSNADSLH